jgi:hypothetical protein
VAGKGHGIVEALRAMPASTAARKSWNSGAIGLRRSRGKEFTRSSSGRTST